MDNQELKELIKKYIQGECNSKEKRIVEEWYNQHVDNMNIDPTINDEEIKKDLAAVRKNLTFLSKRKSIISLYRYPIAAAIVAIIFTLGSIFLFLQQNNKPLNLKSEQDFKPGRNVAELRLSNGRFLNLDNVEIGSPYQDDGIEVIKTKEGEVVYSFTQSSSSVRKWNEILTPRGGQFKIILQDGSKVWLNAASKLRFPASFDDDNRIVEIDGEAYFEIMHDNRRPFRVKSAKQLITVLGTKFNVNCYSDEDQVTTTLLSGSVKIESEDISEPLIMKPGEQVRLIAGAAKVTNVDPSEALAWKNGLFKFEGTSIKEALRQYARWYNVEIQYEGNIPHVELFGETYRHENASQALEMLKFFGLDYEIINNDKSRIIKVRKK